MSLIGTLGSGVSALRTFSKGLEIIGNNIANVNTTGFKSSTAQYADTFSNVLRRSTGGSSSIAVGTGVNLRSVNTNFTQGSLATTGKADSDLAIFGEGYFRVKNPTDGSEFVTRSGDFRWDTNNYLVTAEGYRVQGLNFATGTIADIKLSASTLPIDSKAIDTSGKVVETYTDGSSATTSQILLQNFKDPTALTKEGNNLFSGMAAAGPTNSSVALKVDGTNAPDTNGLGSIVAGKLEQSNVDLTEQFSDLITTQRSFQAGSRLITVSDTILEDVVNLKR